MTKTKHSHSDDNLSGVGQSQHHTDDHAKIQDMAMITITTLLTSNDGEHPYNASPHNYDHEDDHQHSRPRGASGQYS